MFDVQFSFKRAREEAKEEGRKEGKMEGAKENTLELAKNFLKNGIPVKVISDCTGLDEDFLEQLDLDSKEYLKNNFVLFYLRNSPIIPLSLNNFDISTRVRFVHFISSSIGLPAVCSLIISKNTSSSSSVALSSILLFPPPGSLILPLSSNSSLKYPILNILYS